MRRLLGVTIKELLQLSRDRAGLLVLFVMPMALVLIMTLVQQSVLKATGEASIDLLWVDEDRGPLAQEVADALASGGAVELIRAVDGQPLDAARARALVANGDYPFAVVVPAGMSEQLLARAREQAHGAVGRGAAAPETAIPAPRLYIDPTVQEVFRSAVGNALGRVLQAVEVRARSQVFEEVLPGELQRAVSKAAGPFFALSGGDVPPIKVRFPTESLLVPSEESAVDGQAIAKPNAVQHNVPAWTLFAIFFIVVPLSGVVIRERQNGTMLRLLAMPVSPLTLLGGRLIAYLGVGLLQFCSMLAVGFWILPLLGAPALVVGTQWPGLTLVAVAATLAATSYGLLIGTAAGSYEQASMFGAVSVVIAAAVGGVMIPLYAMPKAMQHASILSPLNWGLEAFQHLLVRNAPVAEILPRLAGLLGFAGICLAAAVFFFHHNRKRPE